MVDDDIRNIFALNSLLERHQMQVITATNGQEAINLVEATEDLSLVLMDVMMPEMDGYETMRRIRSDPRVPHAADHRADRQGHEGRPRKVPGGRRLGLRRQTGEYRSVAVAGAAVAASVSTERASSDGRCQRRSRTRSISCWWTTSRRACSPTRSILSELNQNLVSAPSGLEALDKLMRNEFAVVLLDVSMPDMDGFEAARLIHEHPRFERTPIIFVTGVHMSELDRLKGYKLGAVDYVSVPVVPEILRSKVAVLVELYLQAPRAASS